MELHRHLCHALDLMRRSHHYYLVATVAVGGTSSHRSGLGHRNHRRPSQRWKAGLFVVRLNFIQKGSPCLDHYTTFFVCTLQRPPGHPRGCCSEKGGGEVLQLFWEELQKRGLHDKINFTASGCLGPCDSGVNVLVYPENVMYCNVTRRRRAGDF